MPMMTENMLLALSQILLEDPASESPKIHENRRKKLSKRQMIYRLEQMIQEMESQEIEVDLEPYKETVTSLKKIKTTQEYDQLIQDFVECYDFSEEKFLASENGIEHDADVKKSDQEE